ncbi:MAG: hypothetical protein ABI036_07290 [Fibrobacteria bacterium]
MSSPIPWRQAVAAARANLVPGLILQAFALALFLAYYFHAPSHHAMDALAAFKARWGWRYSFVSTAFFGGLIPFLFLKLNPGTRAATPLSHGLFYMAFWAQKGVEVDMFYRLQGWMFGNGNGLATVACKVAVDQLVYSVFCSTPFGLLAFYWKDAGFSLARLRALRWIPFLKTNLPKGLIGVWSVWVPAVIIIYGLPATLQIPLYNIVLCFYALLFATLHQGNTEASG